MNVRPANLFAEIPAELDAELSEHLLSRSGVRIERIVSRGHRSPEGFWYDQDEDEWVLLLSGSAGIVYEGRGSVVTLKPGDHVEIPAHTRHRVEWTDPDQDTVWLAIFMTARPRARS